MINHQPPAPPEPTSSTLPSDPCHVRRQATWNWSPCNPCSTKPPAPDRGHPGGTLVAVIISRCHNQGLRLGAALVIWPLEIQQPLRSVGEPANILGGLALGLKVDRYCVTKLKEVSVSAVLVSTTWLLDSRHDNITSPGYMLRYVTYSIKNTHVNA